jgi:hypothetical protein
MRVKNTVSVLGRNRARMNHRRSPKTVGFCESDLLSIGRLAALLANGIEVQVGQPFPDGWESEGGERTRRYSVCSTQYRHAADLLLAAR